MRTLIILTLFVILTNAQVKHFNTEVNTNEKPWTHLKFYNDPNNFQFAIVSDNSGGTRKGIFNKAVKKLNLLMPEFVMSVGDLIEGYTKDTAQIHKEWDEFNNILGDLKPPFFYLPGNHDITNEVMQHEWEKRYGKRYYHFVYKNVLFITLDSNDDDDFSITEKQTQYVKKCLEENKEVKWTFLFMHHPIWRYDTNKRFESIEKKLTDRNYTVFAGHTHHYHHSERDGNNYYILGTTGGGSRLRGHRFGEMDHISWITLTDDGPVIANLELDGIHDHDITNDKTEVMAESLLKNTTFEHVLLTNSKKSFKNGTLYLYFENSTEHELRVNLKFYHHHELNITNPKVDFNLLANSDSTIAISLDAVKELNYNDIGELNFDWHFSYLEEPYDDFYLEGKYNIEVLPATNKSYSLPSILEFKDSVTVSFNTPFDNLIPKYTIGDVIPTLSSTTYKTPVVLKESNKLTFTLFNDKKESVQLKSRNFEELTLLKSVKKDNLKKGLLYSYYEGAWDRIPNFNNLENLKSGVAHDFLISDIADADDEFGIVYNGYISIPKDDIYLFRMKADDASKLYLHDKVIINDQSGIDFGAVYLQKGEHPIKIDFIEQKGNQRLRMYYKNREEDKWHFLPFEKFFKFNK